MVRTETIELELTESHVQRLEELEEAVEGDMRDQLAQIVSQSIDDTYREYATADNAVSDALDR